MSPIRWLCLLAAAVSLSALPATASARGHDGPREAGPAGDAPARVALRIRRADRALDRAEERVDDGETAKAIAQLAASRRQLNAALRAANRRMTADNEAGEGAFRAVTKAQHRAIETSINLLDGTSGELTDAILATLDNAITGRDAALATAAGAYPTGGIAGDVAGERESIAEALEDDELTQAARDGLAAADAKLQATAAGLPADDGTSEPAAEDGPRDGGRCRDGERDGDREEMPI